MPLDRADIEAALTKKGFTERPDGDHRYYRLFVDGKYTGILTKTSRGSKYKTLSDGLVAAMAKQLGLTNKQFRELVECTMSGDAYLATVRASGRQI